MAQRKAEEAIPFFRKAHQLKPDVVDFHENYANALGETGHKDEAIAAYRTLVAKHPGQASAWAHLSHLLYLSKRHTDVCHDRALARVRTLWSQPHYGVGA
jgi:predicted Zn-dependent protease